MVLFDIFQAVTISQLLDYERNTDTSSNSLTLGVKVNGFGLQ